MLEGEKNKRKEKEFIANHLKVTNFVIYLSHKNKRHYHIQIEQDMTKEQEFKGKFQTLNMQDRIFNSPKNRSLRKGIIDP